MYICETNQTDFIMKIRKVKWDNHPILGNLELDFVNPITQQPYDNILFAGENGTGKTSILNSISSFLDGYPIEYIEYIEYFTENQILRAVAHIENGTINYEYVEQGFYDVIKVDNGERLFIGSGKNKRGGSTSNPSVDNNPLNIRFSGCVV